MEYEIKGQWVKLSLVRDPGRDQITCEKILSSHEAAKMLAPYYEHHDREEFIVICLDQKNKIVAINSVSVGSLTVTVVHPREVFKVAVLCNSAAIIVAHNHPSGDATPSEEDKNITKRLKEAGAILGISLLDHLVIGGRDEYYSFADRGTL